VLIELFLLDAIDLKAAISLQQGLVDPKFQEEEDAFTNYSSS